MVTFVEHVSSHMHPMLSVGLAYGMPSQAKLIGRNTLCQIVYFGHGSIGCYGTSEARNALVAFVDPCEHASCEELHEMTVHVMPILPPLWRRPLRQRAVAVAQV